MATSTAKRPRRTRATSSMVKAASSPVPEPMDPTCGHSGCGKACNVRYCGPTSPMHNHQIIHAARGASQVWTAAIVAGLAVVLTGAIAFASVNAATVSKPDPLAGIMLQLQMINTKLDKIQSELDGRGSSAVAGQLPSADSSSKAQCMSLCKATSQGTTGSASDKRTALNQCIKTNCSDAAPTTPIAAPQTTPSAATVPTQPDTMNGSGQ